MMSPVSPKFTPYSGSPPSPTGRRFRSHTLGHFRHWVTLTSAETKVLDFSLKLWSQRKIMWPIVGSKLSYWHIISALCLKLRARYLQQFLGCPGIHLLRTLQAFWTVASLGLVSPGAATGGVTSYFFKLTTFLVIYRLLVLQCHPYFFLGKNWWPFLLITVTFFGFHSGVTPFPGGCHAVCSPYPLVTPLVLELLY